VLCKNNLSPVAAPSFSLADSGRPGRAPAFARGLPGGVLISRRPPICWRHAPTRRAGQKGGQFVAGQGTTSVFISCVTGEFGSYRQRLRHQLESLPGGPYEVKVQEDFQQGGFTLLEGLADYIRRCDLVIHLAGDACGSRPTPEHVAALLKHLGDPPGGLAPAAGPRPVARLEKRLGRRPKPCRPGRPRKGQ